MNEFLVRWKSEQWLEQLVSIPVHSLDGEWMEYEGYMEAKQLISTGLLLVRFPPEATEDNRLHCHPCSDRRVTVISGGGEFVRY